MPETVDVERLCLDKGLRMTEQRRLIARVLSESQDHPCVVTLHTRASAIDPKLSIATVYRTVRLFEETGILVRHDFRDERARYEPTADDSHGHLINVETGEVVEFSDEGLEASLHKVSRRMGYRLIARRLELYGVPLEQ